MSRVIVITGTDTGVGKTVLTTLFASFLRSRSASVAALKPICSGGRADAHALHHALRGALTLNEINPWHFRAPVAPLLAARQEKQLVTLREVVTHVRTVARRFEIVLVEGAGGLLSPLGEGFSTRELIAALSPEVFIVARNQLGAVNHVRLTREALPPLVADHARIVLMSPRPEDVASRSNPGLLQEFVGHQAITVLPWLRGPNYGRAASRLRLRHLLLSLLHEQ